MLLINMSDDKILYNVITFKSKRGNYTSVNKFVKDYVKEQKSKNNNLIVIQDIDDDGVKSWVVGKPEDIKRMVDDQCEQGRTNNKD